MDDPSNKRRSPSALAPGSQATLLSGSVGFPCRSLVGAALPKTPYRDWKRGVDLFRSPTRRRMTGICAFETFEATVANPSVGGRRNPGGAFRVRARVPQGRRRLNEFGVLVRIQQWEDVKR